MNWANAAGQAVMAIVMGIFIISCFIYVGMGARSYCDPKGQPLGEKSVPEFLAWLWQRLRRGPKKDDPVTWRKLLWESPPPPPEETPEPLPAGKDAEDSHGLGCLGLILFWLGFIALFARWAMGNHPIMVLALVLYVSGVLVEMTWTMPRTIWRFINRDSILNQNLCLIGWERDWAYRSFKGRDFVNPQRERQQLMARLGSTFILAALSSWIGVCVGASVWMIAFHVSVLPKASMSLSARLCTAPSYLT